LARHIAFAVLVTLVASTTGIIIYRHISLRNTLETSARQFSSLIVMPLSQSAVMYGEFGFLEPIEDRVTRFLQLNQDVESLEIVRMNRSVVISANREAVQTWLAWETSPTIEDPHLIEQIQSGSESAERVRVDGRTVYRIVVPVDQAEPPLGYSLVATFGYENLNRQLLRAVSLALVALVLGLIITNWVSDRLARGITKNLDRLRDGVQRIRGGHLDERVEIESDDEILELADAFNDMSAELEQNIERLRAANFELHTLDQMKANLVANVSHELRTPLTALKGYLELLDDGVLGELSDEARQGVEVCRNNVERLTVRVEDLVGMSLIEQTWPTEVSARPVDLTRLIPAVSATFTTRIREKSLAYSFDAPTDLPTVTGDTEQLERVFLNLLDNAVKFTPSRGSVAITIEECDHDGRTGTLTRVTDSGIGIPRRELVRIFDRFHQVDPSIRRRYGGMGLGLSLVHSIVESHRGLVWAESEVDQGATFLVWLPCHAGDGGAASEDRSTV
jgi:signal transduction histidine kinase